MSFLPKNYTRVSGSPAYAPKRGRSSKSGRPKQQFVDFKKYVFRAHTLDKYFGKRGLIRESALLELYNCEVNGVEKVVMSDSLTYGIEHEQESIDLINKIRKTNYAKNTKRITQDGFSGEPDIVLEDKIIDVKSCVSPATYEKKTRGTAMSTYKWQLTCYAYLWGIRTVEIIYTELQSKKIKSVKWEVTDQDIEWILSARKAAISYFFRCKKAGINGPEQIPF